ncbi:hypothetical protein [Sphingobacterium sp. 1.A.4]|uniref:hypothetical protein n=1 Tax=Sphingobacterium sp. 1.A.4 TaxID=2044603 RepID=UPI000C0BFBD1|nr:hypothetical protein [Sphingobacterium sp. 1.A.4]
MKNLARDPWLGEDFNNQPNRLMIIGESHYAVDKYGEFCQVAYDEFTQKRNSTQWIIESLIKGEKTWKVFDNLYRALYGTKDINIEKFWTKVGFYNFIQEPMKLKTERPSKQHFLHGFECLKSLIVNDEFATALFLGTSATQYYKKFEEEIFSEALHKCTHWDKVTDNRRSYVYELRYNDKVYKLIFIAHPSQYFQWNAWNDYLNKIIPEQIPLLK